MLHFSIFSSLWPFVDLKLFFKFKIGNITKYFRLNRKLKVKKIFELIGYPSLRHIRYFHTLLRHVTSTQGPIFSPKGKFDKKLSLQHKSVTLTQTRDFHTSLQQEKLYISELWTFFLRHKCIILKEVEDSFWFSDFFVFFFCQSDVSNWRTLTKSF